MEKLPSFVALFALGSLAILLDACGGAGGSSNTKAPPVVQKATLLVAQQIELIAGGASNSMSVTNDSTLVTVTGISALLPAGWTDVSQDDSACATLAPQASCNLVFTPGNGAHPPVTVTVSGQHADNASSTIQVVLPQTSTITLAGAPLTLVAGSGVAGDLTITNTSVLLTATHITADFSQTALQGNVVQDASGCTSLVPQASCTLHLTPRNTPVSATHVSIRGDNTSTVGATVDIALPTSAPISIAGSPLVLQGTNASGGGTPGTLTVTNHSTLITAANIRATAQSLSTFASGSLLTLDAAACNSVAPGASCAFTIYPGAVAAPATTLVLQGSNTSQAAASVAVNAAPQAPIQLTGSPATILTEGDFVDLVVLNQSSTERALDITATINGTALAGLVTVSPATCPALNPGEACTLRFTSDNTAVAQTTVSIAGSNTQTLTAALTIRSLAIGDSFAGGIVYQLPSGSTPGKVVNTTTGINLRWSPSNSVVGVSETDGNAASDGAANTAAIVGLYGAGSYAAGYCDAYSVTNASGTYSDWYLPSLGEMQTLLSQDTQQGGPIPGIGGPYWSSTEVAASPTSEAWLALTPSGLQPVGVKVGAFPLRCIRKFGP